MGQLDIKIVRAAHLPNPIAANNEQSHQVDINNTNNSNNATDHLILPSPFVRINFIDPKSPRNTTATATATTRLPASGGGGGGRDKNSPPPDQVFDTSVVSNTNHPQWNEVFKLFIPSHLTQQQNQSHEPIRILLQVWHKDVFNGDELLGQGEIELNSGDDTKLVRGKVRSEKLKLQNSQNWNAELQIKLLALDFGEDLPLNTSTSARSQMSSTQGGGGGVMNSGRNVDPFRAASSAAGSNSQTTTALGGGGNQQQQSKPQTRPPSSSHYNQPQQQQVFSPSASTNSANNNNDGSTTRQNDFKSPSPVPPPPASNEQQQQQQQQGEEATTTVDVVNGDEKGYYGEDGYYYEYYYEEEQQQQSQEPQRKPLPSRHPPRRHLPPRSSSSQQQRTTAKQALYGNEQEEISIRKILDQKLKEREATKQQQKQQQAIMLLSPQRQQQQRSNSRSVVKGDQQQQKDPYFNLIKKAMDKEEQRRAASKKSLHASVERQHGGAAASNPSRALVAVVPTSASPTNHNNNNTSISRSRTSTKKSRFASPNNNNEQNNQTSTSGNQQQQHQMIFTTTESSSSSPKMLQSLEMHDQKEIRSAIRLCCEAECDRVFLTEQEARCLSGNRISYSIAQKTTAFGNHVLSTETIQEPFCYLCVSIAKALIPQNNNNNGGDGGGVSHCTMIRKISGLLANPFWSSKIGTCTTTSSGGGGVGGLCLLAHGNVELVPSSRDHQQQQVLMIENNNKNQQRSALADQQQQQQQQHSSGTSHSSHVQWAMLHVAIDSPTLFIALHCPIAAETLIPLPRDGEEQQETHNDDGLNPDQREVLKNYYLRKKQKQQQQESLAKQQQSESRSPSPDQQQQQQERPSSSPNTTKIQQQQQQQQQRSVSSRQRFAHRFVNQVFHNIGVDEDEDEPLQDDEDFLIQGEEDRVDEEFVSTADDINNRRNNNRQGEYQYAGQFVDEIFHNLLSTNNNSQRRQQNGNGFYYYSPGKKGNYDDDNFVDIEPQVNNNDDEEEEALVEQQFEQARNALQHHNSNNDSNHKNNNTPEKEKRQQYYHHALYETIKQLNLRPAHQNVAAQICIAVETFLSQESHGRKIKRIVVCCHESVAELGGDIMLALRSRQQARGQTSRKVICVTTSSNLASTSLGKKKDAKEKDSANATSYEKDEQHQEKEKASNKKSDKFFFSSCSPPQRAHMFRLLFAKLCIPVPKLSFDREKRRGWRFVVMPDCFAWALTNFAPNAVLDYQSRDFPTLVSTTQQRQQPNENTSNKSKPSSSSSFNHPPTMDDVTSHLWQALAGIDGALDTVTGGCTLPGFIIAATVLMNGLISKRVADAIWNEVFPPACLPRDDEEAGAANGDEKMHKAGSRQKQQTPPPFASTNKHLTPPSVCQCFNGAISGDYFMARETSFIQRLKAFHNKSNSTGGGGARKGATLPVSAIKGYLKSTVATRKFDALPQGDDQDWNRAFFAESFHEPHLILSRVSANFLPQLSSVLGGTGGNDAGAADAMLGANSSVERMRDMLLKEGTRSAALVRLRLEERLNRAVVMQNKMKA